MHYSWPLPPLETDLPAGEVHLWSAPLDRDENGLRQCTAILSEDERRRAEQFRAGSLRNRYIGGRGTLRMLLARYLRTTPESVSVDYQAHGKPELAAPWNASGLQFNLSHSHELALFACTRGHPIGVDIEWIRPMSDVASLLERFFSPDEVQQWREFPRELQLQAFFQGWTRKEAWLKAVGSGLSFPLREFCVTFDDPAQVLSIRGDRNAGNAWWLESCLPAEGYVAAVAMRGPVPTVKRWRFAVDVRGENR